MLTRGLHAGVQYSKTRRTYVAKARVRMSGPRDKNNFKINLYRALTLKTTVIQCKAGFKFDGTLMPKLTMELHGATRNELPSSTTVLTNINIFKKRLLVFVFNHLT